MNTYELVFITKDGNKDLLKNTETLVKNLSGKVTAKDDWGEKHFAYKLKGLTSGHYHVWNVELDNGSISELKSKLNLEEGVIRYLLVQNN